MSTLVWQNFKHYLSPYLFVIYALVWTLVCFLMEFSPTFQSGDYWYSYSIFGCYNLSISIIFFALVGLTKWEKSSFLRVADSDAVGIGASVFFLRVGTVFFSVGAVVLWGIEFFLAFAKNTRPGICIFRTCLYIIFHGSQLLFILKSERIVFNCDRLLVYFGLAHTIAVNLWIWVSLCIAKSGIGKRSNETYHVDYFDRTSSWVLHGTEPPTVVDIIFDRHESKLRAVKLLGNTAITLLTGNVEFCLIGAGVCLSLFYTVAFSEETHRHRRANYIKFDYKNTGISMFLGYTLSVLLILSVFFGNILRDSNYLKAAGVIMGVFGLSYYTISIIVSLIVFYCLFSHIIIRHQNLNLNQDIISDPNEAGMNHEKVINVIFLLVGASGEVLYCSVGLLAVISGDDLSDDKGLVLATFIVRALEVLIQALLLFYLLDRGYKIERCTTIGKQAITFLILLNLILFGFHTVEGSIRSFGFPDKLDKTSKIFHKISLPLVVFFRFHCSVCFAEIWKMYYHEESSTTTSSERSGSTLSVNTQEEVLTSAQNSADMLIRSPSLETTHEERSVSNVEYIDKFLPRSN